MAVEVRTLPPPKDVVAGEVKNAKRVDQLIRSRLQPVSERQLDRLQKHVKKVVKNARREQAPLRKKLVRYSDLLEGVVEETNFPFEGASNVTLRAAAGTARKFEADFNPALYADSDLFAPDFDPGAQEELKLDSSAVVRLQEGFNHSFSKKFNGLTTLKGGTIPAFRDGTFLINGSWERNVQRVNDQRTYRSYEEFVNDYGEKHATTGNVSPIKGVTRAQFLDAADFFLVEGPDAELIVRFSHNYVKFDGIEYSQVLRAKFLIYPTTALKIDRADLYGALFDMPKEEVKRRAKKGEFYKEQAEKAVKRRGNPQADEWDRNRLFVEGLTAPDADMAPMRLGTFVVKFDLDDDGVVEQHHVTVCLEGEELIVLATRPYDLRHNVPDVVPFRLVRRDHAFDGVSLCGDGEDMFNQIDTLFRHDNNVMMLTTSPMFMVQQDLKENIDLGRAECVIRPGVTYYVPDITKSMKQLEVVDVAAASGDNNTKLQIIGHFLEMLIGITSGPTGENGGGNPRDPASKLMLLMLQSGKSTDRKLDEWCDSLPELAKLHATLMYQYSGETEYKFVDTKGQPSSFPLKLLADPRLRWTARRRSVTLTPEFALQRLGTLFGFYAQIRVLLLQGDPIAIELWNRTVKNSGEPQCEKFLMDPAMAPQMAAQALEKARMQFLHKAHLDAIAAGEKKLAQAASAELAKTLGEADRAKLAGLMEEAEDDAQQAAIRAGQQPDPNAVKTAA